MSTYSPSLRIELIGEGEQVNIWGETTNSNLGTIIESAIVGNTNVLVTSTDQVLTVSNGAPDQSRNAVLVLTTSGAVTTAFNIFAPPVNKTYIVVNNSAYNATLYNSTFQGDTTPAGSGVLIAAGKTVQAWSEGINFYLSASSVDLPLAASQGGTGLVSPTANSLLAGNGANPLNLIAPSTSGNILVSNGTTWNSSGNATVNVGALNAATVTATTNVTTPTLTSTGELAIQSAGVNAMTINTSQNISIPNSLTVVGTATFSGAVVGINTIPSMQVFTTSGTFTIPANTTRVRVTVVGGGGGGSVGGTYDVQGCPIINLSYGGNGGGSGGTAVEVISGLTPGNTVTVTIGAGGVLNSGTGGTSSFGAFCSATGAAGGTGGTGVGGTLNIVGATGGAGGGSSGGPVTSQVVQGTGAPSVLGKYGSGGNGGSGGTGSTAGAAGVVIVEY